MPSLVTSIIGGVQGASASHHAADYLMSGYSTAGKTVTDAVNQVNPEILATAAKAGAGVTDAATAAGTGVTNAAQTAGTGATTAAATAGAGATDAARAAGTGAVSAAQTAGTGATDAAGKLMDLLSPYIQGGAGAMGQLTAGMAPGGSLSLPFTADMMAKYSPAYQFQLQQGQQAAQRAAAAGGLTGSGGTMKALNRYAQDYSGTAFTNAANLYNQQQQLQFNRLQTLAGMGQTAATTGGQAGQQAAEYAGTLGTQAAQYAGTMGTEAAQYAGNLGTQAAQYAGNLGYGAAQYAGNLGYGAAQYAGNADIAARNLAASNTMSGANYLANTQINSAMAHAQGDLGAAGQWNNMLNGVGSAANAALFGGLGAGGGWSFSNFGKNLWGPGGGSGYTPNFGYGGGAGGGIPGDMTGYG